MKRRWPLRSPSPKRLAFFIACGIATAVGSGSNQLSQGECGSCTDFFSKLGDVSSGKRSQYVEMQLRGEPKSGTRFMYDWASNALFHACDFLNDAYGEESCRVTLTKEEGSATFSNRSLIFEPSLGSANARCSCHEIDRVVISVSKLLRHTLPVDRTCRYWHPNQIAFPDAPGVPCLRVGRKPVQNHVDLRGCMREGDCKINDNRLQFVTMRDPRPMTLSAYYHRRKMGLINERAPMGMYVIKLLPHICAWLTLRHIIFTEDMANLSTLFWYEDSLVDPLQFHDRWLESVGLHMPASVVQAATDSSASGNMMFNVTSTQLDVHSGGDDAVPGRSWENEIGSELFLDAFEEILRLWLPPDLISKLGVAQPVAQQAL